MTPIDGARIRSAIRSAEEGTSVRMGVRITHEHVGDPLKHARADFARARLHHHAPANGVLFLVAPKSRKFAVYGGDAIHARLGDAFWNELIAEMRPYFVDGDLTEGLIFGIARLGQASRAHFPSGAQA